jgi:CHAT domain-containing protein
VLMGRFHNYLHGGASEVAALSRVQREALRDTPVSSPFLWAGFVLVGGR